MIEEKFGHDLRYILKRFKDFINYNSNLIFIHYSQSSLALKSAAVNGHLHSEKNMKSERHRQVDPAMSVSLSVRITCEISKILIL